MKCTDCGKYTYTFYTEYDAALCDMCSEKKYQAKIEEKSKSVSKISDFSGWSGSDMSELFWISLGRYVKHPDENSLSMMYRAYMWAVHENRGLSNSFNHALKWTKIDLFAELDRWADKTK